MTIINLKRYYYPLITRDTYVEVSADVARAFAETEREDRREDHRKYYYGVLSLDQSESLEFHAAQFAPSPEELMVMAEDELACELLYARLHRAMELLTVTQRRRLLARYWQRKKLREIAEEEGVSMSVVSGSLAAALRKLRKVFRKNQWTRNENEEV